MLSFSTKPFNEQNVIITGALNIELLDYTQQLVCDVEFLPKKKLQNKQRLEHMNLQIIYTDDEWLGKECKIALLTAKMICNNMYGSLV